MINLRCWLVVGLCCSFTVYAIPKPPTFGVVRAGPTTTYTVGPSTYSPITQAPTGTSLKVLDANYSAAPAGYITQANIPVGETIAAVKVTSPVSTVSMAAAVVSLVPKLSTLGIALQVGMALYDYLHNAGLSIDATGAIVGPPVPVVYPTGGYCRGWGYVSYDLTPQGACSLAPPSYGALSAKFTSGPDTSNLYKFGCYNSGGILIASVFCQVSQISQCASPKYWDSIKTTCMDPNTNGTGTPITTAAAQDKLMATPPADPASVIENIHTADPSGASDPAVDGTPSITLDTSPMYSSPPKQTVTPDGQVQTSTTITTATQTSPQSFSLTENTTTTTTHADGSTTTVTTNNAPPAPTTPPADPKTDCDKYPKSIGCSEYGTAPPELLTTVAVPVSLAPTSLGSGTCPAPATFTAMHRTMMISYGLYCDFATAIAPLIIAFAWLSAGFIVMGSVKE